MALARTSGCSQLTVSDDARYWSIVFVYIRNGGLLEHHGDYAEDERGGLKIGDGTALIDIGSDSGSGGGVLKLKNDVTELVRSLSHDGIIVADGGARDVQILT
ncbi:MAG: hypothetical protein ISS70_06190 [Phycisphaerae bacterium]|nr:hypothetical protein [Phycisphaerae bacterium]